MFATNEVDRLKDKAIEHIAEAACIDVDEHILKDIIRLSTSVIDLLEDIDVYMMEHA